MLSRFHLITERHGQTDRRTDRTATSISRVSTLTRDKNENFQNSRWRTAAILKIIISPYLSDKSSNFDEILYRAADFELDERHVIKNEKVALDKLHEFDRTYFLFT